MAHPVSKLSPRKRYLQVALNGTLEDAYSIINSLPVSDRIIIEAGTPLIKRYGERGIRQIRDWYEQHLGGQLLGSALSNPAISNIPNLSWGGLLSQLLQQNNGGRPIPQLFATKATNSGSTNSSWWSSNKSGSSSSSNSTGSSNSAGPIFPYIVADLKTMDRGETEVELAASAGASAAVALGTAPVETLNAFVAQCEALGLDAMIDMMNVEFPLSVLRSLKKAPPVVIIHRGVDEERFNREKQIPLHEIRRIKGNFDIMISIAGGDTLREVQRSIFNDADIVVVWKSVYQNTEDTISLVKGFLKEIE